MFKHSFLIAYRNFRRFKTNFIINLIGLSTGLAFALMIYLWINDEVAMDNFHESKQELYQVMQNFKEGQGISTEVATPGPLAASLKDEMPEVDKSVAVMSDWFRKKPGVLSFHDRKVKASEQYVGKEFLNIFSYKLIEGDKNQVLQDKKSLLISDEIALKLFKRTENIIGKTIEWDQEGLSGSFLISGVFEKPASNSSVQFDLLFSYDWFVDHREQLKDWNNSDPETYLLLKKGVDIATLNQKLENYLSTKDKNLNSTLFVRQYTDRYLYNNYENGKQAGGRIIYVQLFAIIALFILLIACINFMNLSTAQASRRIKEVGIKKVIGVNRRTLIFQYLGESLLLVFGAAMVAVALVELLLPQFNTLTGKQISIQWEPYLIITFSLIVILTGLLSGSYPAVYLSGFKPVMIFKGKVHRSLGEVWTRKGLVVFQFSLCIVALIAVVIIYNQIVFIQHKNLGYDKEQVIYFNNEGKVGEKQESFTAELKSIPGVVNAAGFGHNLVGNYGGTTGLSWEGKDAETVIEFSNLGVDYGLIETLDFKILAGRTFSREFGSDSSKIIFNEAAIKTMGLTDPIGKTVKLWDKNMQIIGVVKDFHFESMYKKVKPCFLICSENLNTILVKIKEGTTQHTIAQIQDLYAKYNPGLQMDYQFLDQDFQALYAAEKRVAVLSQYFAIMAIIISCLGLFGLTIFSTARRTKEIGIRKILGASEWSIVYLLSSDFTKMVLLSIVIALPFSYYLMRNWLNNFAYRIDLSIWYFAGAAVLVLFIAWLTVSVQTIRSARVNPVHCLREE